MSGKMPKELYATYLYNQHPCYDVLEVIGMVHGLMNQDLRRAPAIWEDFRELWTENTDDPNFKKPFVAPVVKEFIDAVETKTIKEIYWCGGEPLMWDIHWKAMERIIELGFAKEVYIRYNTNLSRTEFKGIKLFDLLPQFQDWQVCASIDGTDEVGEYIRDGLNYKQWLANFKKGLTVAKTARVMRLDYTITLPGLLELTNMFNLSVELDTQILTKVMFTFSNDEILSPLALSRELMHSIIDEALEYIEPRATWKQQSIIDVLKNLKTRPNFVATKTGKQRQERIDKIRKQDITKILAKDERVLEWWTNI